VRAKEKPTVIKRVERKKTDEYHYPPASIIYMTDYRQKRTLWCYQSRYAIVLITLRKSKCPVH